MSGSDPPRFSKMGSGRRTPQYSGPVARNLRKDELGAVIFGCTNSTMNECLQNKLFGLPGTHFSYVQNIQPGLPLFLINYSDRKLYGIFEATSNGQQNINPHAWTAGGSSKTSYSAQVRIRIRQQCHPLSEEQFKQIIGANYYGQKNHFRFELDHAQTGALVSMFELFPVTTLVNNAPMQRTTLKVQHNNGCKDGPKNSMSDQKRDIAPEDDARAIEEKLKTSMLVAVSTLPEDGATTLASSGPNSSGNEETQDLERNSDKEGMGGETCGVDGIAERSIQERREDVSTNSNFHSVINQLCREVEELRAFHKAQLTKITALEKKKASSDIELQKLRDRVEVLESQLNFRSYVGESSESHYNEAFTELVNVDKIICMKNLIFVMGGSDTFGTELSTLDCYQLSKDTVRSLKPMSAARSHSSAAVSGGCIYTFGGCGDLNGALWYDTVECYNPYTNEWVSCPSLSERTGCLASATLQNKIFAFGGGNEVGVFSKVEMFDPDFGQWILMQPMLEKRSNAAAIELNGVFYVVGGYCDRSYLKSAERFDPREVSWSKLPDMNIGRGAHSLAVLNGKLYALGGFAEGGFEEGRMSATVEVFDPRMGSWVLENANAMMQSRGYFFAPVIGDTIYTIGGMIEQGTFAERVDCYKEGCGWSVTNLNGIGKRSYFSAIIV